MDTAKQARRHLGTKASGTEGAGKEQRGIRGRRRRGETIGETVAETRRECLTVQGEGQNRNRSGVVRLRPGYMGTNVTNKTNLESSLERGTQGQKRMDWAAAPEQRAERATARERDKGKQGGEGAKTDPV